jgi:hypothetical protein
MKATLHTQRVTVPTVFVTKGRQRVKQYNQNVYLKNGDEFELELFNPTTNKVLAKISLNGKSLGSGIILRPGERVFLERYLDEAKKFLFETYEIDASDPNVEKAIKNNGVVDVEFYDEYRKPYIVEWPIEYHHYYYYPLYQPYYPLVTPTWTYYSSTLTGGIGSSQGITTNSASYGSYNSDQTVSYAGNTQDLNSMDTGIKFKKTNKAEKEFKETGRVEKGSYSEQHFTYDSTSFNYYCSWRTTWIILPESQKALVKEDLKVFCTNCGSKRKKSSHQFCPKCGNRF